MNAGAEQGHSSLLRRAGLRRHVVVNPTSTVLAKDLRQQENCVDASMRRCLSTKTITLPSGTLDHASDPGSPPRTEVGLTVSDRGAVLRYLTHGDPLRRAPTIPSM